MNQTHVLLAVLSVVAMSIGLVLFGASAEPSVSDGTVSSGITPEGDMVVMLTPEGYEPAEFSIPVGTTVTFKSTTGKPHWPASNLHPTHDIYSEFDPKRPLEPDEAWSFTFDQVGMWNFHDHIRAYYTGTVYVTAE